MTDKELKKLREIADRVQCGHRACKELVKAIKEAIPADSHQQEKWAAEMAELREDSRDYIRR
ncbi:MAG: hypothetical protein KAS32_19800 [Candidatus Peribacteraceae bacterium]|nr:hypothetical protein [Candidatus Peribacteraceae bacterium]